MRILAVDDDQDFLDLLADTLGAEGIELVGVTSGREALKRLDREHFDVVVLDLVMPSMDGRAVARRIRQRPRLSDLPIVMVTHVSNVGRIDPATEGDANHFVSKGGAGPALIQLVSSLAGRRGPRVEYP